MIKYYPKNYTISYSFIFAITVCVCLTPELAYAQAVILDNTIGNTLCDLIGMMTGLTGKVIATLAVMFIGIGSFFGKASWALVVTITMGIALIFGARDIAQGLGIDGASSICPVDANPIYAGIDLEVGHALCQIAAALVGSTGKALSTLAVAFVAIATFFGKASYAMLITITVGISTMFGAGSIVQAIVGSEGWNSQECLPAL